MQRMPLAIKEKYLKYVFKSKDEEAHNINNKIFIECPCFPWFQATRWLLLMKSYWITLTSIWGRSSDAYFIAVELRLRENKELAEDHTGSKYGRWDLGICSHDGALGVLRWGPHLEQLLGLYQGVSCDLCSKDFAIRNETWSFFSFLLCRMNSVYVTVYTYTHVHVHIHACACPCIYTHTYYYHTYIYFYIHIYPYCNLSQTSMSQFCYYWYFGMGNSVVWSCPGHYMMFSSNVGWTH